MPPRPPPHFPLPRSTLLAALMLLAAPGCRPLRRVARSRGAPVANAATLRALATHREAPRAYARAGDLELRSASGAALTVAASEDLPGHRPLRGAVLDAYPHVARDAHADASDPLLWWRPAWIDADDRAHPLVADAVRRARCDDGSPGVRTSGSADGVRLEHTLCALPDGRFRAVTRALDALPDVASLGDELAPGSGDVATDTDGVRWRTRSEGRALVAHEFGASLLLEPAPGARLQVHRRLIEIAAEVFRAELRVRYPDARRRAERTLSVHSSGLLSTLSRVAPHSRPRTLTLRFASADAAGALELLDAQGNSLGRELLAPDALPALAAAPAPALPPAPYLLRLPAALPADRARVYDRRGLLAHEAPLAPPPAPAALEHTVSAAPFATLHVAVVEDTADHAALAAHVLLRRSDRASPLELAPGSLLATPGALAPTRAFVAGPTVYALDGVATLALAPGRYRVTATHGPTHTLATRELELAAGATASFAPALRRVVTTTGYVSADLHLHAAPSPDSRVSLEQRVASLVCEGVELAVSSDHNRVSDYADAARSLGVDGHIVTLRGNEVTSAGRGLLGHFNAFPLPPNDPARAPEERVSAYFERTPRELFDAARAGGAAVLQVNHPRMAPSLGYFDLLRFDPRTGFAADGFATDFDAVEAFNGMWLESPERVREGARDLVGLARRGLRVAATGNSDSHHLHYEEAGWPRTYLAVDREGLARDPGLALADALRRGETTVSGGPFVELWVEGRGPGATVAPRAGSVRVRVRVRVQAPAWVPVERVELWVDNAPRALEGPIAPGDGVRFEQTLELPVARDTALLAWAEGRGRSLTAPPDADESALAAVLPYRDARALGFTGLVYVDADDDGVVRIAPAPPPAIVPAPAPSP